ncbi:hypothetical protein VPH35_011547 [Triticum aestivum]
MLRHRCCVLTQLLSFPSASPTSQIHRLISAAAPAVSPNPSFAVQDYPAVVAGDPKVLCSRVEGYLGPVVAQLTGLGLSRSQVARLISYGRGNLHLTSIVSKLQYYLPLFGSIDNTLRVLKRGLYLISSDLERVVKPNLCIPNPWLLTTNAESIRAMVSCAESLGVPRGSRMFRHAVSAVAYLSEEKIAAKVGYLKKTFRWSDAEVSIAVSKHPILLTRSKDFLRSRSEFLISEVELEPAYIAHRPAPYHVVKFLKENELLDCDRDYYSAVMRTEKVFMEKYICPHMEDAPHLAEDYAEACRGEVPTRFRFA